MGSMFERVALLYEKNQLRTLFYDDVADFKSIEFLRYWEALPSR